MMQLELQLLSPIPKALNLNGLIRGILMAGDWWTPFELRKNLLECHGEMHSDSTITARLRDLRKPAYGGYVIEKRLRIGSRAYEYRLVAQ